MARLAAVNFCLFCVGGTQCTRIFLYNKELTGSTAGAFENMKNIVMGSAKKAEQQIEDAGNKIEKEVKAQT